MRVRFIIICMFVFFAARVLGWEIVATTNDVTKTIIIPTETGGVVIKDMTTGRAVVFPSQMIARLEIKQTDTLKDLEDKFRFSSVGATHIDLNCSLNFADLVLIAKLEPVLYENAGEDLSRRLYDMGLFRKLCKIDPVEILKGSFNTNGLFVMKENPRRGKFPDIKKGECYLLFLKQGVDDSQYMGRGAPSWKNPYYGTTYYFPVADWRGMIALDENASEQRAIKEIKRQSDINLFSCKNEFIQDLKLSISSANISNDVESIVNSDLPSVNVFEKLNLGKPPRADN